MIPVVMIHKGNDPYLEYSIGQATKNNKVIFIGDTPPCANYYAFKFVNINSLDLDRYNAFGEIYVHLNTTPPDYELFCYRRWFLLLAMMKAKNLETVFYIDSDVMLFPNINDEWEKSN